MILMINGAFGVGKSSVANYLKERLPDSIIYDPEAVGILLRYTIPEELKKENEKTGDFQDFELWPKLSVMLAEEIKKQYGCHLIVPMTLRKVKYFDYFFNGFIAIDKDIHHFCLTASYETIHKRLQERGEEPGSWPFQQTDKCILAFENYNFGEYIDTENMGVEAVGNVILGKIGKRGDRNGR